MDAAKLRELAAQAQSHVGEWDEQRAQHRRSHALRSCAQCAFWSDQFWDGSRLLKVPHGCGDAIVADREVPWRVQMDRDEAEKCICAGWVDNNLADLLRAGYAFDAIALEVRKPDPAEAPGGRERLAALVRARGDGRAAAVSVVRQPTLIGPSIVDIQRDLAARQRAAARPAVTPPAMRGTKNDVPKRWPSAGRFVRKLLPVFIGYIVIGLVINVLSDGGALNFEELFSRLGLSVVLILSIVTTALVFRYDDDA